MKSNTSVVFRDVRWHFHFASFINFLPHQSAFRCHPGTWNSK